MLRWENRPIELANLLNPAFCSLLIGDAIAGFFKERQNGLPYAISFFVLPLILHSSTRNALPRTIATKHHVWLEEHHHMKIGFAERARQMIPYTREAISFAMCHGTFVLEGDRLLLAQKGSLKKKEEGDSEVALCRKKAEFLGRWLAHAGEPATLFLLWGVCP